MAWVDEILKDIGSKVDWLIPEEWFGYDITPGTLTQQEAAKLGTTKRKQYSCIVLNGSIKDISTGRTLGYTPQKAKKKYKTRRRRKRLTQRDKAILAAIQQNPAAAASLMLMI